MKIVKIEPTPSPNSMKIIVDTELPTGTSYNYKKSDAETAPSFMSALLNVNGIRGIYHVMNFLAVERTGNVSWETILADVQAIFNEGETTESDDEQEAQPDEPYGEVYVHVQTYKDIPLQVKVFDSDSEERFGLSERFVKAMDRVQGAEVENYILLRKWADYGIRYGEKSEIGQTVVQEIEAAYPEERLEEIIRQSEKGEQVARGQKVTLEQFSVDEWEKRFQLLDQMPDPDMLDVPVLDRALEDEKMSIRRLATVYLGMIEDEAVIPYIEKALQDKSWAVRRTAGDCMSDLGFEGFEDAAIRLLKDRNKLVRWRAAMFLYETGTEKALPALKEAEADEEFEVKLQVRMATARIAEGEEAQGSVWKQMTEARTGSQE